MPGARLCYAAIQQMVGAGLVAGSDVNDPPRTGRRRQHSYLITPLGIAMAEGEAPSLAETRPRGATLRSSCL